MGRLLQSFEYCCFDRGTNIILREFSDRNDLDCEIYLYDIFANFGFIDNNRLISLKIVFNSK